MALKLIHNRGETGPGHIGPPGPEPGQLAPGHPVTREITLIVPGQATCGGVCQACARDVHISTSCATWRGLYRRPSR